MDVHEHVYVYVYVFADADEINSRQAVTLTEVNEAERRKTAVSFLFVLFAVPAAWAAETLARRTIFSESAATISEAFGPSLRRLAWISFGLTLLLGVLSVALRPALRRRYDPGGAMMAGASIPQVPAILACAVGVLGADPRPVAATAIACTIFVALHRPAPPS